MRLSLSSLRRMQVNRERQSRAMRRRLALEQLETRQLLTVSLPELISVNEAGTAAANGTSMHFEEALSADGRYYVFTSDSSDVVSGDVNGTTDVFLRDLQTGATTLISRAANGGTANNTSDAAAISADGNFVAFQSYATNLDVTGTNSTSGYSEIYRWDRNTGQILLVSPNDTDTDGGNNQSYNPSISQDGQRVAFETSATDLVANITDANYTYDVYLRDLSGVSPKTVLVSHAATGATTTGDNASQSPQISRDGSRVIYLAHATDLEMGLTDLNGPLADVVVFSVSGGSNRYVSVETTAATSGNVESTRTSRSLSADGRFEVFSSRASDLVQGAEQAVGRVPARLADSATTLISRAANGGTASNASDAAVISADGNFVAFRSSSTNLDVTGTNSTTGGDQIYRWDRNTGQILLVSPNDTDTDGGNWSSAADPSISADGQRVAFESAATDLVAGITDADYVYQVYLRDYSGVSPTTVLVSHAASSATTPGNGWSHSPQISRDGSRVVYASDATDLEMGLTDLNGPMTDVVVFSVSGGSNRYVSAEMTAATSGNAGVDPYESIFVGGRPLRGV